MRTTRSIAVVGLRTAPRPGLRSDFASAVGAVRSRPYMWLLGIVGFSLRGGIVLLTLPIIVLPTQVEVRMALGSNLTSTGLTDGFWMLVAGLTLLSLAALVVILFVLARVETAVFVQLTRDPHSADQRSELQPRPLNGQSRRHIVSRVYAIQSTALLAILLSAVPMAMGISDATLREIVAPSSSDPIYVRVLAQVRELALVVVATIFLTELISAVLTRRVLIGATGLTRRGTFTNSSLRLLAVAAFGWAMFIGAVALGVWAISFTWQAAQSAFLSGGWSSQAEHAVAMFGAAILLSAVFALALLLCGIVSALRASMWSLASLR